MTPASRLRITCFSLLVLACDTTRVQPADTSAATSATPVATPTDSARRAASQTIPTPTDSAASPADVLREYYAAIEERDYDRAYSLWSDGGRASKQTRAQFVAGFTKTSKVTVTVRDSTRVEGAAGSQYATVPVVVDATLSDGRRQRFEGSYVLRRSMVDGATPEQRRWRIYSASLSSS